MLATSPGDLARFVRTEVVPRVLPPLVRLPARAALHVPHAVADQRSTTAPAASARAARAASPAATACRGCRSRPGDDNFAGLDGLRWQVHVYGAPSAELAATCRRLDLVLTAMRWQPAMRRAGLAQGALYLVRPDGHVALADPRGDAQALERAVATVRGPSRPI